jgi:hypothetical protein
MSVWSGRPRRGGWVRGSNWKGEEDKRSAAPLHGLQHPAAGRRAARAGSRPARPLRRPSPRPGQGGFARPVAAAPAASVRAPREPLRLGGDGAGMLRRSVEACRRGGRRRTSGMPGPVRAGSRKVVPEAVDGCRLRRGVLRQVSLQSGVAKLRQLLSLHDAPLLLHLPRRGSGERAGGQGGWSATGRAGEEAGGRANRWRWRRGGAAGEAAGRRSGGRRGQAGAAACGGHDHGERAKGQQGRGKLSARLVGRASGHEGRARR